ncbi:hypothetical protein [Thalassobaculum sp.]|uniref:hypothetical protein n=1 Tax=Thalassobaculum sp. TaxID=2022740 RepID=UPI003B59BC4C
MTKIILFFLSLVSAAFFQLHLAHATNTFHKLHFFYDKDVLGESSIEIGKVDIHTQVETPLLRTEENGLIKFTYEHQHDNNYYNEIKIYIDTKSLPKQYSLKSIIDDEGTVRTSIIFRFRKHTPVERGYKLFIFKRFAGKTKTDLDEFKSSEQGFSSDIIEKLLNGNLGYELLGKEQKDKRIWARIRFDGALQLALSEKNLDLTQITDSIYNDYNNIISRSDSTSVSGNFLWIRSNYLAVDTRYVKSLSVGDCKNVNEAITAMKFKNDQSDDEDREIQKLPKTHFEDLALNKNC